MSKNCANCAFFQAYYVKIEDKFLKTNRGYCNKKSFTSFMNNICEGFENCVTEEKFIELTKDNLIEVIEYIKKIAELLGIRVDDKNIGECDTNINNTNYNDKLK